MMNNLWTEKWRPQTIDECALPTEIKAVFKQFVAAGEIPHLLLTGTSGVGKTTVALAACKELGCDTLVINASDESGIDVLRTKIKAFASAISLLGGIKVVILDEADYLNSSSFQPALRNFMEEFSANCRFILTCNFKQKILIPLQSRLTIIDFHIPTRQKAKVAAQIMKRVEFILQSEEVEYDKSVLPEVIMKYFPDFRKTISELQLYNTTNKKIDVGILSQTNNLSIDSLIKFLKAKDFNSMRKFVNENLDNDSATFIRLLYDNLERHLEPISYASTILTLAEYQYKSALVTDQEINMTAMLIMIMSEAVFKK